MCHYLAGQQPILEDMSANREYLQRLAIVPYGDGFMKMPLSRGSIALGYSPVIPSLPLRQVESLICMKEYGIMITSKKMNTSSPLMKKPVSRHGIEFTTLIQQSQAQR